jgi:TatA/E family protein of Tat protein translocase
MGPLGAQEMFFIGLLALLLFGPKKLPELGRMLGKGLTEFRRAKNELKNTFESHMQELDREARVSEIAESTKRDLNAASSYTAPSYSYPYDEYGRQDSPEQNGVSSHYESPDVKPAEHVAGTVPHSKAAQVPEPVDAAEENRPA